MFLLQKCLLMQVVLLKCDFLFDFTDKRIQAVVSYMSITVIRRTKHSSQMAREYWPSILVFSSDQKGKSAFPSPTESSIPIHNPIAFQFQ